MFDKQGFLNSKFRPREGVVDVPDMAAFFPDDCKELVWKVRGITADELAQCTEAADKMKNIASIVDSISGGSSSEKATAIKSVLGIDSEMNPDTVKRLEILVRGSVDIDVDLQFAVKISEVFPIEFFELTNVIMRLTGLGQELGK